MTVSITKHSVFDDGYIRILDIVIAVGNILILWTVWGVSVLFPGVYIEIIARLFQLISSPGPWPMWAMSWHLTSGVHHPVSGVNVCFVTL